MAATIRTCSFCGKLFQSLGVPNCPQCSLKLDEDFVKVRDYLYANKGAALHATEIAEKTGVSEKAVLYFLKEGKLARKETKKVDLVCARCGAPILSGRLCSKCVSSWNSEVGATARGPDPSGAGSGEKADVQAGKARDTRMHTRQDKK